MSSALRTCLRSTVRRTPTTVTATRSFQTSRVVAVGKESTLHNENRAAEVEHHKQDQLQKQKEGKGQWKDELASESESIVKADRGDVGSTRNTKDDIRELQRESTKIAQDEKRSS